MAERPDFSVIIPFYNNSAHLADTLASVAHQDVGRDRIETIIVDDCSEESEARRLTELADASDMNCRVVRQPENKGPGHARNRGFRESTGKWIAFLDADDRLYPHKLSSQVELLQQNGVDAVISDFEKKKNEELFEIIKYSWALKDGEVFEPALAIRCGIQLGSILLKRDTIQELDGFRTMRLGQDKDFFVQSVISGHRWVYQSGVVSEYCLRDESISAEELNYLKKTLKRPILLLALKELRRRNMLDSDSSKVLADKFLIEARRWAAYGYWDCAKKRYSLAKQLDPNVQLRSKPFFKVFSNLVGFLPAEKIRYFINALIGRS